jgi:hypothetical protein
MTTLMSAPLTGSTPTYVDDRFVVLTHPHPGTVVELAPGSQLAVKFRRCLGPSRWHIAGLPGHLLVLDDRGHEFQLLVFGAVNDSQDGTAPIRFERRHPEREIAHEVCELLVVPVNGAAARTSRSASPRTA